MSFLKRMISNKVEYLFRIHIHDVVHIREGLRGYKATDPPMVYAKLKRGSKVYKSTLVPLNVAEGKVEFEEEIVMVATLYYTKSGFEKKAFIFSVETAAGGLDYSVQLDLSKYIDLRKGSAEHDVQLRMFPDGILKLTVSSEEYIDDGTQPSKQRLQRAMTMPIRKSGRVNGREPGAGAHHDDNSKDGPGGEHMGPGAVVHPMKSSQSASQLSNRSTSPQRQMAPNSSHVDLGEGMSQDELLDMANEATEELYPEHKDFVELDEGQQMQVVKQVRRNNPDMDVSASDLLLVLVATAMAAHGNARTPHQRRGGVGVVAEKVDDSDEDVADDDDDDRKSDVVDVNDAEPGQEQEDDDEEDHQEEDEAVEELPRRPKRSSKKNTTSSNKSGSSDIVNRWNSLLTMSGVPASGGAAGGKGALKSAVRRASAHAVRSNANDSKGNKKKKAKKARNDGDSDSDSSSGVEDIGHGGDSSSSSSDEEIGQRKRASGKKPKQRSGSQFERMMSTSGHVYKHGQRGSKKAKKADKVRRSKTTSGAFNRRASGKNSKSKNKNKNKKNAIPYSTSGGRRREEEEEDDESSSDDEEADAANANEYSSDSDDDEPGEGEGEGEGFGRRNSVVSPYRQVHRQLQPGASSASKQGSGTGGAGRGASAGKGKGRKAEAAHARLQQQLDQLLQHPNNGICADCSAELTHVRPWAVVNWGVFVCIHCGAIHRALGKSVSRVMSVELDEWSAELVEQMGKATNVSVNGHLEYHVPVTFKKPRAISGHAIRRKYIRAKYVDQVFTKANSKQRRAKAPQYVNPAEEDKYSREKVVGARENGDGDSDSDAEDDDEEEEEEDDDEVDDLEERKVPDNGAGPKSSKMSRFNTFAAMEYVGMLSIHLAFGRNLPRTDVIGGADPYVIFQNAVGDKTTSRVVPNSLNPKWGQNLELSVPDRKLPILFEVWDRDRHKTDDFMGRGRFSIAALKPNEPEEVTLQLHDEKGKEMKGHILLELKFTPQANKLRNKKKKNKKKKKTDNNKKKKKKGMKK